MEPTPVDPQFVLEHAAHVRALASRLVFDGTRAEDLEQETWLAALKNAPQSMTSPRGWLARIAQRRAVHDWRAASRRAEREHEAARAEPMESSESILVREETRSELVRAVLALDEPYRAALVAQFLEERSSGEAARRRNVLDNTHRTHVKRALELLRERLKRSHGAEFGAFQLALVRDLRLEAPLATTFVAAGSGLLIGGLSMGTAKKVAAVVLVALAAWIGLARPWKTVDAPTSMGTDAAVLQLAEAIEVARPAASGERAVVASAPNVSAEVATPAAGTKSEAVVVVARIVDEDGRPIVGASGTLASSNDSWNETTPRNETFRGTSDGDGALRIEAPPTTSTSVQLTIDAGPWRTRLQRSFDAEKLDRIVPGTNDAGELMLRPAGRVRGRVTADGAPVPDALVQAISPVWTGAWMAASSTSNGTFEIDSVDPSVNELHVMSRIPVTRLGVVPVVVQPGVENVVGEIALQRAPTIEGRVTDARGDPIADVTVNAMEAQGYRSEFARTRSDGSFVVCAPESGAYDLSVRASQFVRAWSGNDTAAARFTTGARDVHIVLDRVPATTFRLVTDDGAVVREFGLGVRPLHPGRSVGTFDDDGIDFDEQWPRIAVHESNEVTEAAEPALHEVFVAAPGFVPLRASVAHDARGTAIQTLQLERGHALRGRVVRRGAGLVHAQIVVERAWIPLGAEPSTPGTIEVGRTHAHDVGNFSGRSRSTVTDSEGSFELTGLPAGTYDVRAASGGDVVARADLIVVHADSDCELGDLVVRAGATVRGVVDAGAQSPVGWTISIRGRADLVVDRADGRFEFTGLDAGVVELTWYHEGAIGIPRVGRNSSDSSRSMQLELVAGATRDVRIDVADLVPARVTVTVRADGVPLVDVMPTAAMRVGDNWQSTGQGTTRADGTWTCLIVPGITTMFQVATTDGLLLATTEAIVLAPGEQRAIVLEARTGVLEVRLPDDLAPSDAEVVRVDVRPVGTAPRMFRWADWHRHPSGRSKNAWTSATTASGRVGEGTWTARVEVLSAPGAPSTTRGDAPRIPAVERTITIRAGETTVFDLR